jgi:hypothetical protein
MTPALLNLEIIESVCRQMPTAEAKKNFWIESLTLSLESLTISLMKYNAAIVEKNPIALAKASHKISGTIGFVGALKLCDRLNALQAECDSGNFSWPFVDEVAIRASVTQIMVELEAARLRPPV